MGRLRKVTERLLGSFREGYGKVTGRLRGRLREAREGYRKVTGKVIRERLSYKRLGENATRGWGKKFHREETGRLREGYKATGYLRGRLGYGEVCAKAIGES